MVKKSTRDIQVTDNIILNYQHEEAGWKQKYNS